MKLCLPPKPISIPTDRPQLHRAAFCLVLLALVVLGGCSRPPKLDTSYGKTYGTPGQKSVNGTSVLVEMFEQAGHDVTTIGRFSPRLENADTIVWFPDDFAPPSEKHRLYLEEWLLQQSGRTVVYVGRDYDAASDYWRQALPHAKPEQAAEYHRQLAESISNGDAERARIPAGAYARWFKTETAKPPLRVTVLEGPWAEGIDTTQTNIQLATRYQIPELKDRPKIDYQELPEFEVLLSTKDKPLPPGTAAAGKPAVVAEEDPESPKVEEEPATPAAVDPAVTTLVDEPIVTRVTSPSWYGSQVIVVANGSFLLNLPLVNKEHRKLAGRLIDECGDGGQVVFVESAAGGPPIRKREENPTPRTGFDMLAVWPLNVILLHTIGWLLLVCICLYPIFGRPRKIYGAFARGASRMTSPLARLLLSIPADDDQEDAPQSSGDFGRHLTALGELTSLTGNRAYAEEKLRYYHEHVKRDSGASHVPAKPAEKPTTTNPA